MPPPTTFIAVQCFQCSTMQVKQQKKNSNKWTCVVCNQKQSVRKVHAQGFMAKDLRKFVQSFNMSRKSPDPDQDEHIDVDDQPLSSRRKRTNWTEYLDREKVSEEGDGGERICEPEIVTEFTKEMLKKPKLKNNSTALKAKEGDQIPRTKLSKTNVTVDHLINQDKEPRKYQQATATGTSKLSDYVVRDDDKPRKCQAAIGRAASKWDNYLSQDEDCLPLNGRDLADEAIRWGHAELDPPLYDLEVEEDIHPDFE